MGKIVVNKHKQFKENITSDEFVNKGEIVISNQVGSEGIFVLNMDGEAVFIPARREEDTDSSHILLSAIEYDELVKNGKVIVDGKEIIYNDKTYYAIYEADSEE